MLSIAGDCEYVFNLFLCIFYTYLQEIWMEYFAPRLRNKKYDKLLGLNYFNSNMKEHENVHVYDID